MPNDPEAAREAMRQLVAAGASAAGPTPPFEVDGVQLTPQQVIETLRPVMTERRMQRIEAVVAGRTRTVVPVVEGLVNTGNVSAVMRSAEALGYQQMHVVTTGGKYKTSERTSQGADKWLDVGRWDGPEACAEHLHKAGYRIVATHLDETAVPIGELDFTRPTALVFGNERDGVSDAMLEAADRRCIIPSSGFTESFYISVAAALALYHAREDRRQRQGHHADLTPDEQATLQARFCMLSVTEAEQILSRALAEGTLRADGDESG
jgi:tRNA (guanosine-2'-O-)-methyltransferase